MDADILAADAVLLAKINTQLARDRTVAAIGGAQVLKDEWGNLLTQKQELRFDLLRAIAVNYMKPSTATTDASIDADTVLDMKKLSKAVVAMEAFVLSAGTPGA